MSKDSIYKLENHVQVDKNPDLLQKHFASKPYPPLNPISRGVVDPGNTPGFNFRALDCCLTLKLCVCFQKYKLTSHEKKTG